MPLTTRVPKKPSNAPEGHRTVVRSGKEAVDSVQRDEIRQTKPTVVDVIGGPFVSRDGRTEYTCKMYGGGKDKYSVENRCETKIEARLVEEYKKQAAVSGALTAPRSMRPTVRQPIRWADVGSSSPEPPTGGSASAQARRPRKNDEAVGVNPIELTGPFGVLKSSDKRELIDTVAQHLTSTRDDGTKQALEECTKRLNMEEANPFLDLAKVAVQGLNLDVHRKLITAKYCGLLPFAGFHSSPDAFHASKYSRFFALCSRIGYNVEQNLFPFTSVTPCDAGARFMTNGQTSLQNEYFRTFCDGGSRRHEICKNDLVQVVVGELFSREEEFHVQALRDFVMPPETSPHE